jgi:hypothetical protein
MGTFGMRDNTIDDRPVILPQSDRLHAFQPSHLHVFCDLCAGRWNNPIHDPDAIRSAALDREINMANERARVNNR